MVLTTDATLFFLPSSDPSSKLSQPMDGCGKVLLSSPPPDHSLAPMDHGEREPLKKPPLPRIGELIFRAAGNNQTD